MMEVRIKGNKTGVRRKGDGCQVAVGPTGLRKVGVIRQFGHNGFHLGTFLNQFDFWQGAEGAVGSPGFGGGKGLPGHDFWVGGEAQEAQHGDAAEGKLCCAFLFPIELCPLVVLVVFVGQGQPNIDIQEINDRVGLLHRQE